MFPRKLGLKSSISDESRYYLRDILVFLLTLSISIVFSEFIFFGSEDDISIYSKIDTYLFILIPFFILSLILSYIYRNKRNLETGKIRSSIRYRLTLAFLFVALIPSLPIFFLSSNLTGKLIEGFYRVDISNALKSALILVLNEEEESNIVLLDKVKKLKSAIADSDEKDGYAIFKKAIQLGVVPKDEYYLAYLKHGIIEFESQNLSKYMENNEFLPSGVEGISITKLYLIDKAFTVYNFFLSEDFEVRMGKRIHHGKEAEVMNIVGATNSYEKVSLWKEKIPTSVRITIAVFSFLMFLFAILFSFLFARRISKPIINLANATKKVSLGESDIKIEKTEEGEMGILIDSFNQMVADLKAKNEELMHTQRIAAWKEVAQRMAHEIKNPLTPIQLSAQRIQRKFLNKNTENMESIVTDATETIIGQVRVLEHLVKEFSEFARMPAPVLINQQINPILTDSVALFRGTTDIEFELKLAENLPEVFLDKRLFLGVINNLVKNAVEAISSKYPPTDEPNLFLNQRKKIRIMSKLQKKALRRSIVIEIDDSGPGLKEEWKEKIFEPYFSTKENHGSGIGLAIVQKTIIDHHGHISVEDSKLGGCKFRIEIPLDAIK